MERRLEFDMHVWNHAIDPFQMGFDFRESLPKSHQVEMLSILKYCNQLDQLDELTAQLRLALAREPSLIFSVLQIVGLTRSKIKTDLKGAGISIPSKLEQIHVREEVWTTVGDYLGRRLYSVLNSLTVNPSTTWSGSLEALNQATWPGWIRQERAKRQGHEAEGRIARMLQDLGLMFAPKEKSINPLCPDVQVNAISFDIVSPSLNQFQIGFKSTVQTSNIGQFGESKGALEVREALQMIRDNFENEQKPLVMAMIDGVGFQSNTAGLSEILETADEFCQFATLWKAAIVVASKQDACLPLALDDCKMHSKFLARFDGAFSLISHNQSPEWVMAGEAHLMPHSI